MSAIEAIGWATSRRGVRRNAKSSAFDGRRKRGVEREKHLKRTAFALGPVAAFVFAASGAIAAGPLPQGGHFVFGEGSINAQPTSIGVKQTSARGVIDWRSFSIGSGNSVAISNGTGATLSRVSGSGASMIDGKLSATGSLYLINPQGVVIGSTGVISTGERFVASTLPADPGAFMAGGDLVLSGTSNGAVLNLGKISASGGDIFLISRTHVENRGDITASKGTAELAAGSQILLHDSAGGQQVFVQAGSHGNIYNTGAIKAAQISVQAADGNVFALAGRNNVLHATGTTARDGHIWLVADGGTVHAHGSVVAANADGSGGIFDMHGAAFHFDNVTIDAAQWNLTTPAYTAGPLAVAVLARTLSGGTSVTVDTIGATGDIRLLSNLRWKGGAALTLNARRTVIVGSGATIANTGAGNLTLRADSTGANNHGSVVNRGTVDWSHGTGVVAALYDSNGTYTAGTVKRNAAWVPAPFSGLLSQATAYQLVNSRADLENVSNNLTGIYALGKDVDLSGTGDFSGIGNALNAVFTGQFDGMGHAVRNMTFNGDSESQLYIALFSTIGASGVVRNLGVLDAYLSVTGGPEVAILAGLNQGIIANSHTSGSADKASVGRVGGLVVQNDGVIERSSSSADAGADDFSGGLAAQNNGLIVQSFSTGGTGGGDRSAPGGLVGDNNGTITQSYSAGGAGGVFVGGLVSNNAGTISESFSSSRLYGLQLPEYLGGIANNNSGTIANNVFWDVQKATTTNGTLTGTPVPTANGLTTVQMGAVSSFGPTWDFSPSGVWAMPLNGTHPVLSWELGAQ